VGFREELGYAVTRPLRPPWSEEDFWDGFHSAWINTMVRQLNGSILPRRFRARPQVHLGPFVEADVATLEGNEQTLAPSAALPPHDSARATTAAWAPPAAVQTLEIEFPAQDAFEVRVYDEQRGMRLVGMVEIVSPGNKDREENRHAFVAKCAGYLQEKVGVIVVDIVTSRRANLHLELMDMFVTTRQEAGVPDLYAVSYCNRKANGKWQLDLWPYPLTIGGTLPTVPLWLASQLPIPIDLESS
jgi:Protein of unknown function (DUF4058)